MSKVCIVFDRLRTEEKMLQKEASNLGYDAVMLDAKITQVNTDSKKEDYDFGDIVLQRCVSYIRGLHFTASLEFMDIPVLNKFDVARVCGNKMFMSLLLKKNNIPTPKTYFSFSSESAAENLEKVGYPLVIKPVIGSWGRGVMPIKDKDTMEAVFEIRNITDSPHDRIYYLQELIKRPPRDIRVITIGDEPIAAMSPISFVISQSSGSAPSAMFVLKLPVDFLYMAAIGSSPTVITLMSLGGLLINSCK